jgi:hypothetical protein
MKEKENAQGKAQHLAQGSAAQSSSRGSLERSREGELEDHRRQKGRHEEKGTQQENDAHVR